MGSSSCADVVWRIQNFDRDLKEVIEEESLLVELSSNGQQPDVQVRFFFGEYERTEKSWTSYETVLYLNLEAELISPDQSLLPFSIRIKGATTSETKKLSIGNSKPTTILSRLFHLGSRKYTENMEKLIKTNMWGDTRPKELCLRLNVMLNPTTAATTPKIPAETCASDKMSECASACCSLSETIEKMYNAAKNFPDVTLETNDMTTVSAHRFILAGRSPYLAKLFEKVNAQSDYNGPIKIDCSSEKPLKVLLNWVYTEKISDEISNCISEVIQLAVKLELLGFIEALDKTLIGFCTSENMFQLYRLAEEYNMNRAFADLAEFIKKNVGIPRKGNSKAIDGA